MIIINKHLYALRESGLSWCGRLADCLHDMGFQPFEIEPEIWIRKADNKNDPQHE